MLKHSDPAAQITTRGGIPLEVRPARHDDRGAILELLKAASPDDFRFRFLAAVKPSDILARVLAEVDRCSREDLIAFDERDGSLQPR